MLRKNRIYSFCMLVFPFALVLFFTTMLDEGVPKYLPIGVVDHDNSSMSRGLVRTLDAMQSSRVAYRFASVTEARNAMQEGKVYAYLYIPDGTAAKLLAGRRPKISYYYTMTCLSAGSMASKDLKTLSTLGSAAVGQAMLSAKGATSRQIRAALQPIAIDAHMIANPYGSYNYTLTTVFVPGILMLFMALLSAYSVGMELKFETGKDWLARADNKIVVAILGKYIVHAMVFALSASRWWMEHRETHVFADSCVDWFRYLRLRPDAVNAHVDEYLVAMVCAGHLDVRFRLSRYGHGYATASHVVALPAAPLLDDVSGDRAERLPCHRCVVPSRGTHRLHAATLVRSPQS